MSNMQEEVKKHQFYEVKSISYFKGQPYAEILEMFKQASKQKNNSQKHEIRKRILGLKTMLITQSEGVSLKFIKDHISYTFQDQYSGICLKSCEGYHTIHAGCFARQISLNGIYECDICYKNCTNTEDVQVDAFFLSYFNKVKNFQNSTLIFQRTPIGSIHFQSYDKAGNDDQQKTLIVKDDQSREFIEFIVLQIANDEKIKDHKQIISKMMKNAVGSIESSEYQERELIGFSNPFMINLICLYSNQKIRNPLIHKNCKPAQHSNKMIAFSFEHVYYDLFHNVNNKTKEKKEKIKCPFPSCDNFFSVKNFEEAGIIISKIQEEVYQQRQQCILGEYYQNFYDKNWHLTLMQNRLKKQNNFKFQRHSETVFKNIRNMITPYGSKHSQRWTKKSYSNICKKNKGVIQVEMGEFNTCPVRCKRCQIQQSSNKKSKGLKCMDFFLYAARYFSQMNKKCPLCNSELINLIENVYIDLILLKFIFIEGFAKQIFFDIDHKKYFHKINYYTGNSLKQKLKQQKKTKDFQIYRHQMNIKLDKTKKYVPFININCVEGTEQKLEQRSNHFIFVIQNQRIPQNTSCPSCGKQARVDMLEYDEQLEHVLKIKKNQLKWTGQEDGEFVAETKSIVNMKYYSQITQESKEVIDNSVLKLYWKNYQGSLIKYPFRFKKCRHPFETTICDFADIIYQIKMEGKFKFRCRYKECQLLYDSIDEMEKLPSLDLYRRLDEQKEKLAKVINTNAYWITYNTSNNQIRISATYQKTNTNQQQKKLVASYRTKLETETRSKLSKKDLDKKVRDLDRDIKNLKKMVYQDETEFEKSQKFIHSLGQGDFLTKKTELRNKNDQMSTLKAEKQKLDKVEFEKRRKENKTSSINFTRLGQIYPSQTQRLEQRMEKEEVDDEHRYFENYKTYGNTLLFNYPVPKYSAKQFGIKQFQYLLSKNDNSEKEGAQKTKIK